MRRLIPVHYIEPFLESGNRRHLKMGMELPVFIFTLWVPFVVLFALPTKWGVLLSFLLWIILVAVGKHAAKKDPYLTDLYIDALRYGKHPFHPALRRYPRIVLTRRESGK